MNNKIMGRKCNLELGLVTPSCNDDDHTLGDICQHQPVIGEVTHRNPREEEQKGTRKLTIFYNGRVSSCDVTEIQARSIISVASEEILLKEKEAMTPTCSETSLDCSPKPRVMYKQQNMKRSLQQFLQKRRTRIRSTSPYCTP